MTPTQADLDNLTAAITSLESHPADALAGHAEHLNGLRGRLAVLHTAAQEAATARLVDEAHKAADQTLHAHDEAYKARIRGYFPADPLTAKGAAPTPENHALGSPPGFALAREDLLMPGAADLLSRVDFKTGPIPDLAHPGELLIALGKPTDNHRSMMPIVVAFHSAAGVFVLDSGEVSALDLAKAGEVVIRAKLPERPVVAAGADNFTASQLKRRRDRLERRLAHLQARTADRDPRTVQYDTAEASALQTALALFDDAIAVRAPARRWLKDQVASIDPDLPAAEMTDEQLRGVVGVHILRLRRQLDEAEAALDRRTAEVEASNFRHGELVAERAALRRELAVGRTPKGADGDCCATMRAQLAQDCPEHGKECPDYPLGRLADGRIGLRVHDGGSSVILIHRCPWCGAGLRSVHIGKIEMVSPLVGEDADPLFLNFEARRADFAASQPPAPLSPWTPEQQRAIGSFVSRVTVQPRGQPNRWEAFVDDVLDVPDVVFAASEQSAKNLACVVIARRRRPDLWPPEGE